VSPGRCWLPAGGRSWGWTSQLYATRSEHSWGIGDLADLRTLRAWAQEDGAGFLLVNPLHAVAPTFPQEDSPYLPATRRFRNPVYLAVEEVPGAQDVDLSGLAATGRGLNESRLIDRDEVWRLKLEALELIFGAGTDRPEFERWRTLQGRELQDFAAWSTLVEEHGPDWRTWDSGLRDPGAPAVTRFAQDNERRVTFHAWLQWLLDVQLRVASADMSVIQDLPIGVAGAGVDAWTWQEVLASGPTVGAPPDLFNSQGQDWGSPPFIPWQLRAQEYEPFIASIRATMAAAGGVRIDHVMGLFRLWWVPQGHDPTQGAYVRYPSEDLLDIVALESHRAGAVVVGEDLGTVEPGVREALAEHDILSYRVLWFEDDDPEQWPANTLAAVTTHDLPTVAGLWSGADLEEQTQHTEMARADLETGRDELLERLAKPAGLPDTATDEEAVVAAHTLLARAPSTLVAATLDDALAERRRPNIPGAPERENWCLALPVPLEELTAHPTTRAVAQALRGPE
jgi:4-alpha-glucanotransferase